MNTCYLLIAAVVVVSGCANCRQEHILQLTAQSSSSYTASSYDKNAEDIFFYNEHVSLWLKPCIGSNGPNRGSLCAMLLSPPEHTVSLQSAEVRFVADGSDVQILNSIPRITFLEVCSSPSKDAPPCEPSMRGISTLAKKVLMHSYANNEAWHSTFEISIDPLSRLPGGHSQTTSTSLPGVYAPYALDAYRYWFVIQDTPLTTSGRIFLPPIIFQGGSIALPVVKFAPKIAELCTWPAK